MLPRDASRRSLGMGIVARPDRYCPVSGSGRALDLGGRSLRHQLSAQPSRARAQIDHIIGALNGIGIVLHHQHRVAQIAQMRQRIQQPVVVARMQADGRLIEHIQHAAQLRSDLRRQPDALRFAAGKRGGGALQAQIIEAHGHQKFQPVADLIHRPPADLLFALRKASTPARLSRAASTDMPRQLGDGRALNPHRQAGRLQPLAVRTPGTRAGDMYCMNQS